MTASPIIYLRGYAGDQGGVESTVDDPFYGFNAGSTHVRVGGGGRSEFFAFESPLIRLMSDHGYHDAYTGGRQELPSWMPPEERPKTLWIYRYYDITSKTFDDSKGIRPEIEDVALDLSAYITRVKEVTGAPKVILVGHSTGGLIIRCLLQKTYVEAGTDGEEHVDKVFTYATPHGGIHFDIAGGNVLEWARDLWAKNNMDDFGPERLRQYLTTDGGGDFEPQSLRDSFPPERFFCLVGTNAKDYEVAMGLSRTIVGPQSDGLVQIRKAYVHGSPRAYVHRAHSGRYGIVNSEEGYQNLQRFLFGNMKVDIAIDDLEKLQASEKDLNTTHQAEVRVAIRGLPVLMHDQQIAHHSPILLEFEKKEDGEPIPLFAVFLIPSNSPDGRTCRYAADLAITRVRRKEGRFIFKDHLEQIPLWADALVVEVAQDDAGGYAGRYTWRSEQKDAELAPDRDLKFEDRAGFREVRVPLPPAARAIVGDDAVVVMRASPWE